MKHPSDVGITTKDGLLWQNGEIIHLPMADVIANSYGYAHAEAMVKALTKKLFFTELPDGVRLAFCFGIKELTKDGKKYTYIGQAEGEPARYEVTDTEIKETNESDSS